MSDRRNLHAVKGISLVELLVVTLILGILAAILFPVFRSSIAKAHQTHDINNLRQIGTAAELYLADHGARSYNLLKIAPLYIKSDQVLVSSSDDSPAGNHNLFLDHLVTHADLSPWKSNKKTSYPSVGGIGAPWILRKFENELFEQFTQDPKSGWVIAPVRDAPACLKAEYLIGTDFISNYQYLRLREDSSIVRPTCIEHGDKRYVQYLILGLFFKHQTTQLVEE
jgi:type II secretory pathway pseudopilin PulG